MRAALFIRKTIAFCALLLAAFAGQARTVGGGMVLVVSPHVGEVIDAEEKSRFRLFPFTDPATFQVARFLENPDKEIVLEIMLKNGKIEYRPYTQAEFQLTGELIEARAAVKTAPRPETEPVTAKPGLPGKNVPLPKQVTFGPGEKIYYVMLNDGMKFFATITGRLEDSYIFQTQYLGQITSSFNAIRYLKEIETSPGGEYRIPNAHDSRMFFGPTGRGIPQGEGYVQSLYFYLVAANVGITDNFSIGAMTTIPLFWGTDFNFIFLTPKLSFKTSEKFSISTGLLYTHLFSRYNHSTPDFGLLYTAGTYGNASNQVTAGIGYAFGNGTLYRTPIFMVGGMKRASNRIALISENYFLPVKNPDNPGQEVTETWAGGIYGLRLIWPKSNLDLGGAYLLLPRSAVPFDNQRLISSYILPVYITYSIRFGNRRDIGRL
ncbi:MAG TPA: hypothetical protein VK927_07880 [Adhaeribacter sp.]|nr:hypothetical protein [Adhaeribacter sp.]